jgi:predicted O-linked N-acetylglucosamine transferase (SPINDLY family)
MNLALQHHEAGRLHEAKRVYETLLATHPTQADALHCFGVLSLQLGQIDVAIDLIRRALASNPKMPAAYGNLGVALKAAGRLDESLDAFRQAISLDPSRPLAHFSVANALADSGQLREAIDAYRQAISLNPNYVEAHNNLGIALEQTGNTEDAIAAFRQAIAIKPDYAGARNNLAKSLRNLGQLDDAIEEYRRAIALNPSAAETHYNVANALREKGVLDESIAVYRTTISLKPDFAQAHNNLGNALSDTGNLDEAITCYRKAMSLQRAAPDFHSNLILALHYHPAQTTLSIAQELKRWNDEHAQPRRKFIRPYKNDRKPDRPLRIGYLSPDFRQHVVAQNILPLLRHHDRTIFEITCYAQLQRADAMTARMKQTAHRWREIAHLSDEQVAQQIRTDQIDILVDLALHSADNRLPVFAHKPAPVQISYLGYAGSTGIAEMDYRFSDPHLDPPEADEDYVEKTWRLPRTYWCYQPWGTTAEPAEMPALKSGRITFGCLNNFAKVSAPAQALWAKILNQLPDSRLILHAPAGAHRAAVTERFIRWGISADRLLLLPKQPWSGYTQTYSQIDIALDPFPYNGGITTCDALWMGVPVVTLSGQTPVGRGGRSILCNVGLPELIASTADEYLNIATALAADLPRLTALRKGMRARVAASPLMDAPAFARDVESAYRQMWRTYCADA